MQRLSIRELYSETEPLRCLRAGERIVASVVTDEYLPCWYIGRDLPERPRPRRRRHDGRLGKRRR